MFFLSFFLPSFRTQDDTAATAAAVAAAAAAATAADDDEEEDEEEEDEEDTPTSCSTCTVHNLSPGVFSSSWYSGIWFFWFSDSGTSRFG